MISFPNAKINLGLNVVEKRTDGYHNLETVFYPIPIKDALEVSAASNKTIECELHIAEPIAGCEAKDNLVVKAYNLLKNDYRQLPGIDVYLLKRIPMGAGLGGGSSDASFMIKLLNEQFRLGISIDKMERYAALLGADCALFIQNKPAYATGIGDILNPISLSLKGYHIIIVKPDVFISTAAAYSMITPQKPVLHLTDIIHAPIGTWKDTMINDFEKGITLQFPEIGKIKNKLYDYGAVYASMSGSGSSVYGLFNKCFTPNELKEIHSSFGECYFNYSEL